MKRIFWYFIVAILIIGVVLFALYRERTGAMPAPQTSPESTSTAPVQYTPSATDSAPVGAHTYVNEQYGFSLQYPDGLAVEDRAEAAGEHTTTFENADGSQSFQIFITPYTAKQIDKSRIDLDTHGSAEGTPVEIVLHNGTHALAFFSDDAILGRLREVWFLHGGYLYEVTTYDTLDSWLSGIMQTFTFN